MSNALIFEAPTKLSGPIIQANFDNRHGDERFRLAVEFQAVGVETNGNMYAITLDVRALQCRSSNERQKNAIEHNEVWAPIFPHTEIALDSTGQQIKLNIPADKPVETSGMMGHLLHKVARSMVEGSLESHGSFERSGFSNSEHGISSSGSVTIIWHAVRPTPTRLLETIRPSIL